MEIDFNKSGDGLVPAIIQDVETMQVLMLGYMNRDALETTITSGKVTFYSRTREKLWTKGEESGNYLNLVEIKPDCDKDTLLITVHPEGPACHTGADTCWQARNLSRFGFLTTLEGVIAERRIQAGKATTSGMDPKPSYVASLFREGINKIAQKVGEEAVELVIEAKDSDDERFLSESADLLFHYLILLQAKDHTLADVEWVLKNRH